MKAFRKNDRCKIVCFNGDNIYKRIYLKCEYFSIPYLLSKMNLLMISPADTIGEES